MNAAKVPNQSSWQPVSWYQWLGPQRNGISPETGLFDDTPSFSEIWRVKAGPGFSGLSVVDGKAYTMYAKGQSEYAVCLNAATGEEIWATRTGGLFANSMGGDGPRATPTVVGDRVFTASAQSVLYALDAETGAIIWSQDLPSKIASARVSIGKISLTVRYAALAPEEARKNAAARMARKIHRFPSVPVR